jgi:hypothetical protein
MDAIRVRGLNETCSPLSKRRNPMQNKLIPYVDYAYVTDDYGTVVRVDRVVAYYDPHSEFDPEDYEPFPWESTTGRGFDSNP